MAYNPDLHHRRSIRKAGYDYTQAGAYFVTVCTQDRQPIFLDPVVAGIVHDVWLALPGWFPAVALDEFVLMPNHGHFVIWLAQPPVGATLAVAQSDNQSPVGATLAVAQSDNQSPVGATLAVAHSSVAQSDNQPVTGATARVAPTGAWVQIYGRPLGDVPIGDWVIPSPTVTNDYPRLGDVVGAWKSLVTKVYLDWINRHDPLRRAQFWQRNYYERIVRNDRALAAIRQYIRDNPQNWHADPDNPANLLGLPLPEKIEDYLDDIRRYT